MMAMTPCAGSENPTMPAQALAQLAAACELQAIVE